MAKTLYQILGVAPTATVEEIKAGYVRTAAGIKATGERASAELNAVRQAYEVLSDPAMRARYDRAPYLVGDDSPADRSLTSLLTPRVVVGLLVSVGVALGGMMYYEREKRLARLEQERIEAQRQADEERRREEAERVASERRLADERRQETQQARELERATRQQQIESARRDAAERNAALREQQLRLQREREEYRREQAERARQEREARLQLERDKRLLRELEASRPRKF